MAQKQAVNCDSEFGLRFSKNVFGCGVFNLDARKLDKQTVSNNGSKQNFKIMPSATLKEDFVFLHTVKSRVLMRLV